MRKISFIVLLLGLIVQSFAFEVTAYDESKIGPKECAKGSSYWCQDLKSAKSCGAVKHCIQVVWENKKLPADPSDICETCKQMVQEARDELQSNTTQELIKEVLEGTCRIYFPIKIVAEECEKLVDEFIPELIDMLSSRMDPQMVCSVAWLCNSDKIQQLIQDINIVDNVQSKTPDTCQDCKNFATDLVASVKQMGQSTFKQKLLDGCDMLHGFLRTTCQLEVKESYDAIYNYIVNELTPDSFCALTAMCIDGYDPVDKVKVPVKINPVIRKTDDLECDFCQQLLIRLRDMMTANSTKEEVRDLLLKLCSETKSFADKCKSYVTNYFDEIYDYLTKEMDPKSVCTVMGICEYQLKNSLKQHRKPFIAGTDENTFYRNHINWSRITPLTHKNDIDVGVIKVKFPFSKPHHHQPLPTNCDPALQGAPQCALCEFALDKLKEMLSDKATEEEIKQAIEKVCTILPSTVRPQCKALIEEYGDAILDILAAAVDPSTVCTEIGLCAALVTLTPIKESPLSTMSRLTEPLKAENMQLPLQRMFPSAYRFEGKEACLYCQYSMELLHSLLNMNGTIDSIIQGLDDICHSLPSSWRNQCDTLIENYAEPFLIAFKTQNLTVFCDILDFCKDASAQSLLLQSSKAAKLAVDHVGSNSCDVCETTVEILAKLLSNPDVSKDIAHAIGKVCSFAPKPMKGKCYSIVDVYGQYFIQMLGELADAKLVCQSVDLCGAPLGQVNLIGGKKCTYGPDYWCKTKFHARACKAEKHCQKYVWKN